MAPSLTIILLCGGGGGMGGESASSYYSELGEKNRITKVAISQLKYATAGFSGFSRDYTVNMAYELISTEGSQGIR